MQQSALRSIYGASQPKTKHAAAVSPILDPLEPADGSVSLVSDGALDPRAIQAMRTATGNNWSARANVNRVPQDDDDDEIDEIERAAAGVVLQKKSAQVEVPRLTARFGAAGLSVSNQDADSSVAQKYSVLGQKQRWRRQRSAQRAKGLVPTISPVEELAVTIRPEGELEDDVDLENPRFSVRESFGSTHESESASQFESEASTGRGSQLDSSRDSSSSNAPSLGRDEKQRFVVTRQKKSKFAARIHLPGQNPLYLGRYKSEDAALAACERAFSAITTPRK